MTTYETMRHFADSWGMLAMLIFFSGVILMLFLPGAKVAMAEVAMKRGENVRRTISERHGQL